MPSQEIFELNQKSSDLDTWETLDERSRLGRAYSVKTFYFMYEPLYIAKADTPPFEERFTGYGMTRNTQVRY